MELHPVAQKKSFRMSITEIEAGPWYSIVWSLIGIERMRVVQK